jgi:signal transduction histidine kinase
MGKLDGKIALVTGASKGKAVIERFDDAVIGDPVWLQQVFTNLMSNAIKLTPTGGCVELCCTKRQNRAEVTVTDTAMA